MHITELLTEARVSHNASATSKKRALELLSELIADGSEQLSAERIFDQLIERERLGSTGLGHGVAIPHCRTEGSSQALGALIRLEEPIDFDTLDGSQVDLLFALVVPAESTEEHLKILSHLAQLFSDAELREGLRSASSDRELFERVSHWEPKRISA